MSFYSCVIILTELMMIAMTLHVLTYSGFKKTQKLWYILTFVAVGLCAGAEFLVHGLEYNPKFAIPLTIVTVIQFSIAPLLGVLFIAALGLPHQDKIGIGFLSVSLITEIICSFFGFIFYFDGEGYHRGDGFLIYEIFYFVSLIYLIVGIAIVGRRFRHRDSITIISILVLLVAGILPMTFFKLNVTYIAIGISASICYIYYNDLVQQDIKAELIANQEKISNMQSHMISGLANLIENRDTETGEHISRTSAIVRLIADNARKEGIYDDVIDDHFIDLLTSLAPLHDIGKIVVPDNILKKPGKLTPEEYEIMKQHAALGGKVVREVLNGVTDEEYLSFASDIATYHHERWNGSGYPKGLRYEEIPLCARIMAIADVYDALISKRCYKEAIPKEDALIIMKEKAGNHFDPKLIEVFLRHSEEL